MKSSTHKQCRSNSKSPLRQPQITKNFIRAMLLLRNISPAEIARRFHVSKTHMSNIIAGTRHNLIIENYLAQILGFSRQSLWGAHEHKKAGRPRNAAKTSRSATGKTQSHHRPPQQTHAPNRRVSRLPQLQQPHSIQVHRARGTHAFIESPLKRRSPQISRRPHKQRPRFLSPTSTATINKKHEEPA